MRFETTVDMLCSFSGSFFAKMFGGSYDTRTEPDGSYFIDRSGEHFGQVLNFMRTHRLALPPTQAGMVALQEELEYYQLTGPEYAQLASLAATDYTRREVMDMRARGYTLFSGANLSGLNLARLDLAGCTMERCELRGTDLAKARITNCDFTGQFGRREPQRMRVLGVDRHELRVTPRREPLSGGVRTRLGLARGRRSHGRHP